MKKISDRLFVQKKNAWLVGLIFFALGLIVGMFFFQEIRHLALASLLISIAAAQNPLPRWLAELPTRVTGKLNSTELAVENQIEARVQERTRELENSRLLAYQILDTTPGLLAVFDPECSCFLYANSRFAALFGTAKEEFQKLPYAVIEGSIHPDDLLIFHDFINNLCMGKENQSIQAEFRVKNFHNEIRWIKQNGVLIQSANGEPGCIAVISGEDITHARTTYDYLQHAITHDALTGLYNWSYFNDALEQIQKKGLFPAAVVMIDMDNLKTINDTLGHAVGDEYLHDIGSLLKETFRSCDVVARVGGDEFAVLLPWVSEMDALDIVRRVRARFSIGVTQSGNSLDVLSFGVCAAANAAELMEARRHADRRMYQDKLERKAKYSSLIRDLPMRYEELPRMHARS